MGTLGSNYPAQTIVVTPDTTYGDSNAEKFQTAVTISASEVSMIYSNGSNAVLMVRGTSGTSSDRYTSVYAQGTAASYAAQSGQHVALTRTDDSVTFYMNADLFKTVADYTSGPSTSIVAYGTESGVNQTIQVNGTAAAIAALFEVAIPDDTIPVVAATAGTTITSTANAMIVSISGGAGIITLPPATAGRIIYMVNTTNNAFTIEGNGAETVDGAANIQLGKGANITFVCGTAGAWEGIVTQVGNAADFSVETINGINGSGVEIVTDANPIELTTTGIGDIVIDAQGTGSVDLISAASNVTLTATALDVDVVGNVNVDVTATTGNVTLTATALDVDILAQTNVDVTATTGDVTIAASAVDVNITGNVDVNITATTGVVDVNGASMNVPNAIRPQADTSNTGIEWNGALATGTSVDFVLSDGAAPAYIMGASFSQVIGIGTAYVDGNVFVTGQDAVTGAANPGTLCTKAYVNVTTNGLGNGVQFNTVGGTHFVVKNGGANPLFFWTEGGVAIRATALAVGDVAVFYKVGSVWVSYDFTPVA